MAKSISQKCKNCKSPRGAPLAMHRLYIHSCKKWEAVGWICIKCKATIADQAIPSSGNWKILKL